jgi:hypothetical protein
MLPPRLPRRNKVKPEAGLCVEVLPVEAVEITRMDAKACKSPDDVFDAGFKEMMQKRNARR